MRKTFADDFTQNLIGIVPDESLRLIRDKLLISLEDYEITKRTTEITTTFYGIPRELNKYLAVRLIEGGSEKTSKVYRAVLSSFFLTMKKNVKEVTSDDVLMYLAKCKQRGISDRTVNYYRVILSAFFGWCYTEEIISKNPMSKIKPIKYRKEKETPLDDYKVEAIRKACKCKRDLAMVDFFLSTGCRVSEVVGITIGSIDFKEQKVDVIGKGNKIRTVYINGKAAYSISEYLKERKEYGMRDPLFADKRDTHTQIHQANIQKIMRELGEKAGIERMHPHLLRKTMATNALKRGMSITTIQKILGHSNIATTMMYVTISETDVQNAHRKYIA